MNQDLSIIGLVLHASAVVQAVLVVLLLASLASWSVIFAKSLGLRKAWRDNQDFDREFWAGRTLQELFQDASREGGAPSPQERIFASGMREFLKQRERRVSDTDLVLESSRRAMRASYQREMDVIEARMDFLGSVGSVAPYVGLFGTVWGIMHAFAGLSNMQQVTLATVAPGIAEALVTTAVGLFAAVPAVLAYNRFARDIDRLAMQMESFTEEFSNILARNVAPAGAGSQAGAPVAAPAPAAARMPQMPQGR